MKRLARRLACRNSKFSVYFDHIRDARRQEIKNYLVVAPIARAANFVTGVAVLAWRRGRAGLIHVYRHPIQKYSWELPRGFIDRGESPARAARRELAEETGLICSPKKINSLGSITPDAGVFEARIQLFEARDCEQTKVAEQEFGHRALHFFSPSEIGRMIKQGKIEDPSTLVGFYRSQVKARKRSV